MASVFDRPRGQWVASAWAPLVCPGGRARYFPLDWRWGCSVTNRTVSVLYTYVCAPGLWCGGGTRNTRRRGRHGAMGSTARFATTTCRSLYDAHKVCVSPVFFIIIFIIIARNARLFWHGLGLSGASRRRGLLLSAHVAGRSLSANHHASIRTQLTGQQCFHLI